MWWQCILGVILFRILVVVGDYECHTSGDHISCSTLDENDLKENLTVVLTKEETEELKELQIVNSSISTVKKGMFDHFQNIQTLRLTNTSIQEIESQAFDGLLSLKKVYLTDNYLTEFDSNVFALNNSIQILDLSHNLLSNLDKFDIGFFPFLHIMNISYNRLEYLPESFLSKVNEENNFYLVVDNNPWNCLHSNWFLHLTDVLVDAFCTNKSYDLSEIEAKVEKLMHLAYKNDTKSESENNNFYCLKYSLRGCLFWAFGAIWVGIIIGNMCKLKRMLFTTPRRYEDKYTQCEFTWREPFLREEYSKADTQNKKTSSKPCVVKVV